MSAKNSIFVQPTRHTMFGFFRHIALSALLLLAAPAIRAQQAAWRSAVEPLGGGRYRVELTAAIPAGYHIYDTAPYGASPRAASGCSTRPCASTTPTCGWR